MIINLEFYLLNLKKIINMKNINLSIFIIICLLSCDKQNNGWSLKTKKQFMGECTQSINSNNNLHESVITSYCNCGLTKLMKLYDEQYYIKLDSKLKLGLSVPQNFIDDFNKITLECSDEIIK